jgi:hypothetical protein
MERIVSPGPRPPSRLDDILVEAHRDAVLIAARETDLPGELFPAACPWTFEEAMRASVPGEEP